MKLMVINGPNLNMLGKRDSEKYGTVSYGELIRKIEGYCFEKQIGVAFFQSNSEGCLIDKIQSTSDNNFDGIILNPGAYTHTSIAIRDAIESINIPVVEVHITDIYNREDFRKVNYIAPVCCYSIVGKGTDGYIDAIDYFLNNEN